MSQQQNKSIHKKNVITLQLLLFYVSCIMQFFFRRLYRHLKRTYTGRLTDAISLNSHAVHDNRTIRKVVTLFKAHTYS